MDNQLFKKTVSEIDFSQDEVFDAIHQGIKKGRKEKGFRKKSKSTLIGIGGSAAASAFLVSGLLFTPIANVLAAVPIIGSIYEKYSLGIGAELEESHLISQLNKEAKSNGINVMITSAYYDGNVIGITFKAEGDKIDLEKLKEDHGPVGGYNYHLFNGDEQKQWPGSSTALRKARDGYAAEMEFYKPDANLPENYTLPLTFTSFTGIKGIWKFDIPVKQIPSETIPVKGSSSGEADGTYSIEMESVIKGKATTLLTYKTTLPSAGKENDFIELTVYDNEGNPLSKSHTDKLSIKQKNGIVFKDIRELFTSQIDDNTKDLTIHPEIVRYEDPTLSSLNKSAPFLVESKRFDYKLQVNSIKQDGKELILDYTIKNIDTTYFGRETIQNFAEFIMLIKSDKDGEGYIRSNHAKQMDDDPLHFQSVFAVDAISKVDLKDYSLSVPFGTLSINAPIKMKPFNVKLDN